MVIPLVSIVIPAFNAGSVIGECLESALLQRYPNIEVIVVDDGSEDDTAKVVDSFGSRVKYFYQPNAGLASARNTGHGLARGTLLAWLDADDLCDPDRIALQTSFLMKNESSGMVSSNFSAFNELGDISERYAETYYSTLAQYGLNELYSDSRMFSPENSEWLSKEYKGIRVFHGNIYKHLVWGNFVHPPTVMFRKSLLQHTGPLDTNIPNSEDWEFFIRCSRIVDFGFLDIPLLKYRRHSNQLSNTKNFEKIAKVWITVLNKTFSADPQLLELHSSKARKLYGEWYTQLAYHTAQENKKNSVQYILKALRFGADWSIMPRTLLTFAMPKYIYRTVRQLRNNMYKTSS